jgi:hypothetical protein
METTSKPIVLADLLKLEEAGIKTILLAGWTHLGLPQEAFLNRIDSILQGTNLKVKLELFYTPLHDWWLIPVEQSSPSYRRYRHVNYANPEVGPSIDECMLELYKRVDGDRVMFNYAGAAGGEFLWEDNNLACPVPMEVLTKFMVDRQRINADKHGEVWTEFHHRLGGNLTTTTAINEALYDAFPINEYDHYRTQYVQFRPAATIEGEELNKKAILSNPKSKYFVGSEWAEGLVTNLDKVMEHGVYGFLTSPMHERIPHTKIEDWMLDNIRGAIKKLSLTR